MKTRVYPGMLDTSKEYFTNGTDVMLLHNGSVKKFEEVQHHPELAQIIASEKDLQAVLENWFPQNPQMQMKTLVKCRFGALNFLPDFSKDESSTDFCICPVRGNCSGENIVCKPLVRDDEEFETVEIDIMIALAGGDKNTAIASKFGFCIGTFFVFKTTIYAKVKSIIKQPFLTKQQLAKFLFLEGLL